MIAWHLKASHFYWINSLGIILQSFSFILLYKPFKKAISKLQKNHNIWLNFAFISFLIKFMIQILFAFESLATQTQSIRNWIVGFIHLNMLGILSALGIWLMFISLKSKKTIFSTIATFLFIFAFISSESLLFFQGFQSFINKLILSFKEINVLLFIFSIAFPLAIIGLLLTFYNSKPPDKETLTKTNSNKII